MTVSIDSQGTRLDVPNQLFIGGAGLMRVPVRPSQQ